MQGYTFFIAHKLKKEIKREKKINEEWKKAIIIYICFKKTVQKSEIN